MLATNARTVRRQSERVAGSRARRAAGGRSDGRCGRAARAAQTFCGSGPGLRWVIQVINRTAVTTIDDNFRIFFFSRTPANYLASQPAPQRPVCLSSRCVTSCAIALRSPAPERSSDLRDIHQIFTPTRARGSSGADDAEPHVDAPLSSLVATPPRPVARNTHARQHERLGGHADRLQV